MAESAATVDFESQAGKPDTDAGGPPLSESFMKGAFDRSDGEHRPGVLRYPALQRIEGKEASMTSLFRHACLALLLTATAAPASAQTWAWEPLPVL